MATSFLKNPFVLSTLMTVIMTIYLITEDASKSKLDDIGTIFRKVLVIYIVSIAFMFISGSGSSPSGLTF